MIDDNGVVASSVVQKRPYLNREAASAYLLDRYGIQRRPQTLAKLAISGAGPKYRKLGRQPLYDPDDIDAWVADVVGPARRSTSDTGAKP